MEGIWADVLTKLQSIPLPSGMTFDDLAAGLPSHELGGAGVVPSREDSQGRGGSSAATNQSNFRDEDDEDYAGA